MEIAISISASLLSAALSKIVERTASSDLLRFASREKVEAEIRKWHTQLSRINAVLADAEQKQMGSDAVKLWLRDLKDVVYDVEDVLDEFNYEALRCKLTAKSPQSTASKVRALLPSCFTSLSPGIVFSNVKIGSKLEEITTRLEEIVKAKNELALIENVGGKSKRIAKRPSTSPLVDISIVYGREDDKERIVELLLGGEASTDLGVISIVGMGGLGKTTLAQLAYNDDRVNACFALKAWVCVSEDFDIFKITKTIWQYVTSEPCQFHDKGLLQQKLKEKLYGKKFLIILDDVWNENVAQWEDLCNPFKTGVCGCKLIVTTRNDDVVSTTGVISAYRLQQLSDDACLSLLEKYALGARSFDEFPKLKEICKEICRKCRGIPLAVKTIGGLLRNKQSPEEWEAILNSDIWDLPEKNNDILPALRLSYSHLPAYLKCCFAYCSLFPKDYEFEKNELVSLWMAEGFLHQLKGKKEMEDLGCEYFYELMSRSFFQQSSVNETKYVMHDLMNDLAKVVAEQEKLYFWLDDKMKLCEEYNIYEKVRHSSFIISEYDVEKRFKGFCNVKQLRTFLALWKTDEIYGYQESCYLSRNVVYDMLPKFKRLRALSLSHYAISMLPSSIGDLKLLRYLNLSCCHITRLPDSVEALYNLQILILSSCWYLVELPRGIKNLIELHNLDITNTVRLQEMPSGIGALTKLQTLSKFIVGEGDKLHIRELKELMHLRGQLSIYGLDKVKDIQDVKIANLKGKQRLDKLTLVWSNEFQDSRNEQNEKRVFNLLEPSQNLKDLEVKSYGGKDFPAWLGDSLFVNTVRITLFGCKKCKALPSLGAMPSLKHLHIQGMDEVERVGHEFYGGGEFDNLETLKFMDMLGWVEWTCQNVEEFSRLRELAIKNCPKLIGNLPGHLHSLKGLEISKCPQLKSSHTMSLPSLVKMVVEECDVMVIRCMVNLNSLTIVVIEKILRLSYLDQGLMKSLATVVDLQIVSCNELKYLWQNGEQPEKRPFVGSEEPGTYGLKFLKKLEISCCQELEMLPYWLMLQGSNNDQCAVEELVIEDCPLIRSFPRGNIPTTLKKLIISNCKNLECLPQGLMMQDDGNGNISCGLQELRIDGCGSLASFPPGKFPAALQHLSLWDCRQLESLTEGRFQDNSMLKELSIWAYPNLNSLLPFGLGLGHLSYLADLCLYHCPGLMSFPENIFMSTPTLKTLEIRSCKNLKSLPHHMHKNLTSLQRLSISECPGILFLCFPEEEGRLPPNLISLYISKCENMKQPMSEWGLNALTSLQYLRISCLDEIVSFPDDECLILPTSLTTLSIKDFKNMESITEGLLNLTSIQQLKISKCPKMRSMPKEGCLPDSLGSLEIKHCKLIGERCIKEKKGDYWPLIAHIPFIHISHERESFTYTGTYVFKQLCAVMLSQLHSTVQVPTTTSFRTSMRRKPMIFKDPRLPTLAEDI